MAKENKTFKHVIVQEQDREMVYQILEQTLDETTIRKIMIKYGARKGFASHNDTIIINNIIENQLELELEIQTHEKPDGYIPMGNVLQGKT